MVSTLTVDTTDILQLGRQMQAAQPIVFAESKIAMERSAILVQNTAKQNINRLSIIDTGQLLNSIARQVQPFEARIGSNKTYAKPVEDGRQSGAPMPPAGALLGWMARHRIPVVLEFVIRRAISRRGNKARPYLVPALEVSRPAINREFVAALKRMAIRVTA